MLVLQYKFFRTFFLFALHKALFSTSPKLRLAVSPGLMGIQTISFEQIGRMAY